MIQRERASERASERERERERERESIYINNSLHIIVLLVIPARILSRRDRSVFLNGRVEQKTHSLALAFSRLHGDLTVFASLACLAPTHPRLQFV